MKAKVSRGGGFRGLLNYVFDTGARATHTKGAERVGGSMSGSTPRELSSEFAVVRQLRPDISRPVWHCSLSLPPGERLSTEKWEAVAADFMRLMGFDLAHTPWVAVRHSDTDKDHIHIVASRIGLDGKVWLGQWEARRAIEATQELERAHGLALTPGLGDARAERRKLKDKEINMALRVGKEPPRQRLQRILDEAVRDKPTVLEFVDRLQAAGVGVRASVASTGRVSGFSFEMGGVVFKGSDLGKRYSWAGLQKAGVTYDEARDRAGLERFKLAVADSGERQGVAGDRGPAAQRPGDAGAGVGADAPRTVRTVRREPEPRGCGGERQESADAGGRRGGGAGGGGGRRSDWASRFRVAASAAKRRAAADADGSVGERAVESRDASGARDAETDRQSFGDTIRQSQYSGVRRSVSEQERQSARKVDPMPPAPPTPPEVFGIDTLDASDEDYDSPSPSI